MTYAVLIDCRHQCMAETVLMAVQELGYRRSRVVDIRQIETGQLELLEDIKHFHDGHVEEIKMKMRAELARYMEEIGALEYHEADVNDPETNMPPHKRILFRTTVIMPKKGTP